MVLGDTSRRGDHQNIHQVQFDLEMDKALDEFTFQTSSLRASKKKRRLGISKPPKKIPRVQANSEHSSSEDENDDMSPSDFAGVNRYNSRINKFPSLDSDEEMPSILEEASPHPPPLNYVKRPVSRLSDVHHRSFRGIPSSPISSFDSPPVNHTMRFRTRPSNSEVLSSTLRSPSSTLRSPSPPSHAARAMRTLDIMSSPADSSSPRSGLSHASHKAHLYFDEDDEERHIIAPTDSTCGASAECDSTTNPQDKSMSANINPFTPSAMKEETKKRRRSKRFINSPLTIVRQEDLLRGCDSPSGGDANKEEEKDDNSLLPSKRVRISDISITRYNKEFLEVDEIASGEFGVVKKARHRLDGIVYAIKVTKNVARVNSRDERVAMNEVFAHAALMKHKHVVRYYNSWVEHGQVYIQNEYCEGGSLANQIDRFRRNRRFFTEDELKKMMVNVAKGLQYIHSKELVHLDIKPGNIFISLDNCEKDHSTDKDVFLDQLDNHGDPDDDHDDHENAHYKIGDLGHVSPIFGGEISPEEGDCRYMAPEFLEMEVDRSRLTKADIFSLGLTVFEAACLRPLPKNSLDDPNYENIKSGDLPYLERYSRDFNNLMRSLVNPEPSTRPSAHNLLTNSILSPGMNKTRSQLVKELKETKEKLLVLEQQVGNNTQVKSPAGMGRNVSILHPEMVGMANPEMVEMVKPEMVEMVEMRQNTSAINMNKARVKRLAGRGAIRSMSSSM